jgi:hypothetical protein
MIYKQRMMTDGRRLSNPRVAGSTPAGPTSLSLPSLPVANHNFSSKRSSPCFPGFLWAEGERRLTLSGESAAPQFIPGVSRGE